MVLEWVIAIVCLLALAAASLLMLALARDPHADFARWRIRCRDRRR